MLNNGFHRGVFEFFDAFIQSGVLSDRYENSEIETVGRDVELSEKIVKSAARLLLANKSCILEVRSLESL